MINNKKTFISLFLELWKFLKTKRKFQLVLLLILILLSAILDVVSIGALVPFLYILTDPSAIYYNEYFQIINQFFKFVNPSEVIIPSTLIFIFLAFLAGTVRLYVLYLTTKIAYVNGSEIKIHIYNKFLHLPYQSHIKEHSSELISLLNHKVQDVSYGVIQSFMNFVSSLILIFSISILIIFTEPKIGSFTLVFFGLTYLLINFIFRNLINNNSKIISINRAKLIKITQDGLGNIRDVILDGLQSFYIKFFNSYEAPLRRAYSLNIIIASAPRYIIEVIALVFLCILTIILSMRDGGLLASIPLIGLLALSMQKIIPAFHNAYSSWVTINSSYFALRDVIKALNRSAESHSALNDSKLPKMVFNKNIDIKNLSYSYENNNKIFSSVNLSIKKGQRIGIIGKTGAGKTTLINLMMGLLTSKSGSIYVDSKKLTGKYLQSFQRLIAHVPQNIFIIDGTISENIALGVPFDLIDMNRVKAVIKKVQLDSLINDRHDGYLTSTGEEGLKFSGGQKQRLAIARALYKKAPILVLDEATSALDVKTEKEILEVISQIDEKLTVIMITHRKSALKNFPYIIDLDKHPTSIKKKKE